MKHGQSFNGRRLGVALALAGVLLTGAAHAEDGTGTATATVIIPITVSDSTQDLSFGKFAAGASGGTVSIDSAGARTKTGTIILSTVDAGTQATFDVDGDANATYSIAMSSGDVLTGPGTPTTDMPVGTFITATGDGIGATGTLNGTGDDLISVGATLTVADSTTQTAGVYTGQFTVTVEYN